LLSAFIENKNLERQRDIERLERQRDTERLERQRDTERLERQREQLQLRLLNAEGLLNMRGAFGENGFSGG